MPPIAQIANDPSAVTLLMIAVSGLTGAVVCLFVWFRTEHAACLSRERDCIERHIKLVARIAKIEP